jgi:hypothetical protein
MIETIGFKVYVNPGLVSVSFARFPESLLEDDKRKTLKLNPNVHHPAPEEAPRTNKPPVRHDER